MEYTAIEAESFSQQIRFPALHIIAHRDEEGLYRAFCLDFDIQYFTDEQDDSKALEIVFKKICEMAVFHIIVLFKKGMLDALYNNMVSLSDERWKFFTEANNKRKVENLLQDLKQNERRPEQEKYAMLNQDDYRKLNDILKALSNINEGNASEMLDRLYEVIKEPYHMKLVS